MIQNGGLVEHNLLQTLNIPNVDLQVYDVRNTMHVVNLRFVICYPADCDFYLEESIHHCPVKERQAFLFWSTTNIVQNKHFVICLIMAFRERRVLKSPSFLFGKIKKSLVH